MYIDDFIWLPDILDKIAVKHYVTQDEVEEVFFNRPRYRFVELGYREGENVYSATGKTDAGRYLIAFFIHPSRRPAAFKCAEFQKPNNVALILSARDMDKKERRRHEKNKDERATSISKAQTLEEISDFWDTHSLADYWDQTEDAEFEVRAKRRRRITLMPEVYEQIETQARTQGILPETLVNLWLAERLQEAKS